MRYFFALFLIFSLIPSTAKADILPDNSHNINNCIAVENIAEYPEYDFVWKKRYRFESTERITNADMICYQSGAYSLYAIQKSDWSNVTYPKADPQCPECGTDKNLVDEPKNAKLFIPSNYAITLDGYVPDTNSAVKQSITVHIDSVSSAGITAHTATTITTDTHEEIVNNANGSLSTFAKALIAIGVLGLGAIACAWKKK